MEKILLDRIIVEFIRQSPTEMLLKTHDGKILSIQARLNWDTDISLCVEDATGWPDYTK